MSKVEFIPFLLLSLALLFLWFRDHRNSLLRHAWLILLSTACISAVYLVQMQDVAILIVLSVAALAWCASNTKIHNALRWIAGLLFVCSALALGLHLMPGFDSLLVMKSIMFTPDAIPYSLYFNFDKTLITLFILGFWYQRPEKFQPWSATGITMLWSLPLVIGAVLVLALLLNYIQFEPKIIDGLWLWMWANLFFTCTAEEALFRGLLQHQLSKRLHDVYAGKWIAIAIAALLFGLAHIGGGWTYVILSTVAGFGYGTVYQLTGRIEASITCHFALNFTHIILFTYPALVAS